MILEFCLKGNLSSLGEGDKNCGLTKRRLFEELMAITLIFGA
jgi:hypothetical protein